MTEKELREIKRRFRPDKNNILSIRGCLVNGEKTIIGEINQPMASCSVTDSEKILGIMKKAISGSLGTNLLDLEFPAEAPTTSDKHKLLSDLRGSYLKNEDALRYFYQRVIDSVHFEGSFAILLASDNYDVFSYTNDGEKADSSEIFSYIVCAVCPVKPLDAGLCYNQYDTSFRSLEQHTLLCPPEIGFMFPAFDNRSANIYGTLYYTKSVTDVHAEFIENIFGLDFPMSANKQKQSFDNCLKETLTDECDFNLVRSVHDQIAEMVQEHKDQKQQEPLKLSKKDLKGVLEYCGIDSDKVEQFGERFDEQFGKNAEVAPKSIVDVKKFQVSTPDVSIKVNPDRTDLVSTEVINGVRYILIRANEGVEVNGVNIDIK
ncbi:MAG: DUF4317 domain-containing protein [Clostridia bacterium]|nr:DUF4317 domain-containing protein [Clostridia bacterium]